MSKLASKILKECYEDNFTSKDCGEPTFRGCSKPGQKCSLKDWKGAGSKTKTALEEAERILQKENSSSKALVLIRSVLASGV
ncbi:MAG: hypothetical protein CBC12_07495 [Candidatus Puniceispirillum sp. TMED52]|jgi:hypothetical protein|nr:MAG: hypothetical protein CBC12_07495 [Candidatus Puniceispirillum sp. TMED52]